MKTHRVVLLVVAAVSAVASIGGYLFLGPGHGGELPLDFRHLPLILGGIFVTLFASLSTIAVRQLSSGRWSHVAIYVVSAGLAVVGTYILAEAGLYDWIDRRITDIEHEIEGRTSSSRLRLAQSAGAVTSPSMARPSDRML
jgi:hypothetical protein